MRHRNGVLKFLVGLVLFGAACRTRPEKEGAMVVDGGVSAPADLSPSPDLAKICHLEASGQDEVRGQWMHLACSPLGTCFFEVNQDNVAVKRFYQADGTPLPGSNFDQRDPLLHSTSQGGVSFIVGTPTGYLYSSWDVHEQNPNWASNWLTRIDATGNLIVDNKSTIDINGAAQDGVSAFDGEWVDTAAWAPSAQLAYYGFAKVEANNTLTAARKFTLPSQGGRDYLAGPAVLDDGRGNPIIGLGITKTTTNTMDDLQQLNLYVHDGTTLKEVPITGPVLQNDPQACCSIPHRVDQIGGKFLLMYKDSFVVHSPLRMVRVSSTGVREPGTIAIDDRITDLRVIKDGFAAAGYDPNQSTVLFKIYDDLDAQHEAYSWTISTAGKPNENPIVVTDGINNGRFAMAWVDAQGIAHVVFLHYVDC